jgi:prepilin-type N-terminal cleavage/methylation domain-containing protein
MRTDNRHGFTLIEISIVLVIIGLIVGGILVGRDLIKAAEIRAQISQIDTIRSAVQTFRLKYNALPGDMTAEQANRFGFLALTISGPTYQDGNGAIASTIPNFASEMLLFWRHLSDAQLIAGDYSPGTTIDVTTGLLSSDLIGSAVGTVFPLAKFKGQNYVLVKESAATWKNAFFLTSIASLVANDYTFVRDLSPFEFFAIDSKLDDGLPVTGTVVASANFTAWPVGSESPTMCLTSVANGGNYNLSANYANAHICMQLRINGGF